MLRATAIQSTAAYFVILCAIIVPPGAFVEGLKCQHYIETEQDTQFKTKSFEVPCSASNTICISAACTDSGGKVIPWTRHEDCENPKHFDCTKLNEECAKKGGTSCCTQCDTDLCNAHLCGVMASARAGFVMAIVLPLLLGVWGATRGVA